MKSRHWFPLDLSALLSIPLVVLGISFLMGALFPAISWFRHLTGLPWLWALGIATGTSFLGTLLLFLAKLPQYRAGIFLRVGSHHLPPREQRLYRVSFWLIVPSIVVLFALLPAAAKAESSDELDALTKEAAKNYSTDEGRRYFDQFQKSIMPVFSKALHTCSESMPDTKEPASFVFLIAADGTVTRVLYSKDPFGECLGTKLSAIKS
ncbi:MAG: hypothetical protein ABJF10_18270, partial [Chthoniobacter sp.]|uniref:hypothetical protein n=1 Tax=Chthoniobacter sp. TaxID=2510640 RepID=UPI0032AB3495